MPGWPRRAKGISEGTWSCACWAAREGSERGAINIKMEQIQGGKGEEEGRGEGGGGERK